MEEMGYCVAKMIWGVREEVRGSLFTKRQTDGRCGAFNIRAKLSVHPSEGSAASLC